jgi:twitching motility protein PilT
MDVNKIFLSASEAGASDVHLVVGQPPIIRVDGNLMAINSVLTNESYEAITLDQINSVVSTLLSEEQKQLFFKEKDLDASYSIDKRRFRINISFERDNPRVVARIIEETKPTLDEIGMPPVVKDLLMSKQGLILLTGPTGCGKSTTLAAMINYINTNRSAHIVTLEDPIEFVFSSDKSLIVQRQVGFDVESFARGLKAVLRQDPNVVMIGELRDYETISAAITLAETGHLVLATLHTFNAIQTVDRILDVFPPTQQAQAKSQLSMLLSAVISQRLIPQIGGGRVAAREILIRNAAVSNLVREGKTSQIKSIMEVSSKDGMITMNNHLKELLRSGKITQETFESYSSDDL